MNSIKDYLNNHNYKTSFKKAQELNKDTNFLIELYNEDFKCQNPQGPLANVPFLIKDNFDFKGFKTTSGSKTLKNHTSIISATVLEKLIAAGAIPVGKTNLDEFGMGGTGLTSGFGPVKRKDLPLNIIGGSSSGSTVGVDEGIAPFALATDTGDSARQPSAWSNKTIGFKPTYGLISRYGLHAFAPSFDTVGFVTTNVADNALLLEITAGYDKKDFTSANVKKENYFKNLQPSFKDKKIAIFKERKIIFSKEYLEKFDILIDKLKKSGAIVEEISIKKDFLRILYPAYQAISFSEGMSQLASINGLAFSDIEINDDIFNDIKQKRTDLFTELVKDRITVGSGQLFEENINKVFIKAKKVRTVLIDFCNDIFKKYDIVLSPASTRAPKVEDSTIRTSLGSEFNPNWFVLWNFNGSPAITLPYDKLDNQTISIEMAAQIFEDQKLLDFAYGLENLIGGE